MPIQQRDPFSWADDYGRRAQQAGQNDSNSADNKLLAVFQEETRRQDPYFQAPLRMKLQENASNLALRNGMALTQARGTYGDSRRFAAANAPAKIRSIIEGAAKTYAVDPDKMLTLADIETGGRFNADAQNPSSSAGGLFQFTDDTAAQYGLSNKYDATANSMAAAQLMRDNGQALQAALGHEPTAGELYLAHQQGAAGAIKLLSNPNAPAENIVGADAVRGNGGRLGMSAGQFANLWMNKADQIYAQRSAMRAKSRGSQPVTVADLQLQPLDQAAATGADDISLDASVALPDDMDTNY